MEYLGGRQARGAPVEDKKISGRVLVLDSGKVPFLF